MDDMAPKKKGKGGGNTPTTKPKTKAGPSVKVAGREVVLDLQEGEEIINPPSFDRGNFEQLDLQTTDDPDDLPVDRDPLTIELVKVGDIPGLPPPDFTAPVTWRDRVPPEELRDYVLNLDPTESVSAIRNKLESICKDHHRRAVRAVWSQIETPLNQLMEVNNFSIKEAFVNRMRFDMYRAADYLTGVMDGIAAHSSSKYRELMNHTSSLITSLTMELKDNRAEKKVLTDNLQSITQVLESSTNEIVNLQATLESMTVKMKHLDLNYVKEQPLSTMSRSSSVQSIASSYVEKIREVSGEDGIYTHNNVTVTIINGILTVITVYSDKYKGWTALRGKTKDWAKICFNRDMTLMTERLFPNEHVALSITQASNSSTFKKTLAGIPKAFYQWTYSPQ